MRQLDNTLRDVFPEVQADWSGVGQSDVSSALGFSNDAAVLVVSPQTAAALQTSAEQLAALVSDKQKLATMLPCASSANDVCARDFLRSYGRRLFRRPLTSAELDRYHDIFTAAGSFEQGVRWTLIALIQSPHTLYRRELGDLTTDAPLLSDYELATELAYTFGDTAPDEALLELAEAGKLSDPEVRVAQARRLLDTPRGREGLAQFFREWLRYEGVRTADRPSIDGFAELRPALIEETRRFLDHVAFEQKGGARELLLSETTFVNEALARFYNLPQTPSDFAEASRDPTRGVGILAQASVLASTAHANASSPTQRGLMVREKFLCRTRPKPPADVPPLSSSDQSAYKTTRQHYENAHARGYCQSCHIQFDPLGFAFEHFDEGGRYRDSENGETIDATGNLLSSDGSVVFGFDGLSELAHGLANDDEVIDCISGQLVAYAFGGAAAATCLAEEARAGFRSGDYGLVELLAQLAREPHFTRRDVTAGILSAVGPNAASAANGGSDKTMSGAGSLAADSGATSPLAASDPAAANGGEPTADKDASASAADGGDAASSPLTPLGITAQYKAGNTAPNDNVISPFVQVSNRSSGEPLKLEAIELRYYLTNEHAEMCPDHCMIEGFYAGIHPSGQGATAQRRYVALDRTAAGASENAYLSITFAAMPGGTTLLQPGESVEVQQNFHTSPYQDFDESNDYSFAPDFGDYRDHDKLTVYYDGRLVWGTPP